MRKEQVSQMMFVSATMLVLSSAGVLGRLFTLSPESIIYYRAVIALAVLYAYAKVVKIPLKIDWKEDGLAVVFSGVLMAIHLVAYFYAIKWSNVAVAMLTTFTFPIMTAFLEPLFFKSEKFQNRHILIGVFILVGLYFVVPNFELTDDITKGALMGLVSAFFFSLRSLILKQQVKKYKGVSLMIYQMAILLLFLTPVEILNPTPLNLIIEDLPYLLLLAIVITAFGHTMLLKCYEFMSLTTVGVLSSVQPIYGILLGIIVLDEIPSWKSLIGGVLILATVVYEIKASHKIVRIGPRKDLE